MRSATANIVRRADYQEPNFWIRSVELCLDLNPTETRVTSTMQIERNRTVRTGPLRLQGEDLNLLTVLLNGENVPFHLEDGDLVVETLLDSFTLDVRNTCSPEANSALSGLYVSGTTLVTQCEPEGFRRITYFLDRPDVMATYVVTLSAEKARFPVLLSNGNLVGSGDIDGGKHYAVWSDPFPKPSYLFALVAGDLACRQRRIMTRAGQDRLLEVFVRREELTKTEHAMESLVAAIEWDEARFGLPLDLERFMIVGVSDFNAGAMENKGLNIFNTAALLASHATETDLDFANVESVVAHEYFHNWTGNRVTCRDWFQLSLKEGLTVFRHQEFGMDRAGAPSARAVRRIQDVRLLRNLQFPEDGGAMTHAVRPDTYSEISNFYTATVYAKGAEVVRMVQSLVGRGGFEAGLSLYLKRHDGQAVTCDEFLQAMSDANPGSALSARLEAFKCWYSQAGTPRVSAYGAHDAAARTYTLKLTQHTRATSGQEAKMPQVVPVVMGLLDNHGRAIPLLLRGESTVASAEQVLVLDGTEQTYVFEQIECKPIPSLFRGFSAPVALEDGLSDADLLVLLHHDSDSFNRWEAGQRLLLNRVLVALREGAPLVLGESFISALRSVLNHPELDCAFKALVLTLPEEGYVAEHLSVIDPQAIHTAVMSARTQLASGLRDQWIAAFEASPIVANHAPDPASVGRRALANLALAMLVLDGQSTGDSVWSRRAYQRINDAGNMTERLGALAALVNAHAKLAELGLARFYARYKDDPLVLDKWFAQQVTAPESAGRVFERARQLLSHADFNLANPNRARSVLGNLCLLNPAAFHRTDGAGYRLWAEYVLVIDGANPQIAARLARAMDGWAQLAEPFRVLARAAIARVAAGPELSRQSREVIDHALAFGN